MPRNILVGPRHVQFTLPTEPFRPNAFVWVDVGGFLNIDIDGGGGFSLNQGDFELLTDIVPQNQDRIIDELEGDDDEPLGPEEPDHDPDGELLMIDGGEDEEVLF